MIMLINIIEILVSLLLLYLVITGIYQLFLAVSYFLTQNKSESNQYTFNKFAVIVPAHNEELLIAQFCQSILSVDYNNTDYDVYIIADNCNDRTESICSEYSINVLARTDRIKRGKGYALEWALERISLDEYDAVIVLDADTTVDKSILSELNKMLNNGEQAIQCYIDVPNRHETWFTQLIYLSRTINDLLYHSAKNKLGLSSYLMGTGMCFHNTLLKKMKWGAYSLSEDWEYYAKLIQQGYRVAFAEKAIIRQMETSSLSQATTQRLRWSSGRFYVVKNIGLKLLVNGILGKNIIMADASLALLLPNWSLQVNLILLALIASVLLPSDTTQQIMLFTSLLLLIFQMVMVFIGLLLVEKPLSVFMAIARAPAFLLWKLVIDIACVTGLYKGKEWIRTKRHLPK